MQTVPLDRGCHFPVDPRCQMTQKLSVYFVSLTKLTLMTMEEDTAKHVKIVVLGM